MVNFHRFTEVLCLDVECAGTLGANEYSWFLRAICTCDTKSFIVQGKVQVSRDSFFCYMPGIAPGPWGTR